MSTTWTLEQMHYELGRARELSRRWVKLRAIFVEVSPHYAFPDGEWTVVLNPSIVRYEYIPRSVCPAWLRQYVKGRGYTPSEKANTINEEKFHECSAFSVVEMAIIMRRGYTGYVQDQLPF